MPQRPRRPPNEQLRQQRIRQNWRLHDVAEQLGIAETTVQRWETGRQSPSLYYCNKLCQLFGLSAQELGLVNAPSPLPSLPDRKFVLGKRGGGKREEKGKKKKSRKQT